MTKPLGESLYRAAAFIATIVALLAALNFISNSSEGEPIIPLPALALAVIVWLTGLGCRYVLDDSDLARHKMTQV